MRNPILLCIFVFSLLFTSVSVNVANAQTNKEWIQLKSKNFFLIGDASEKDLVIAATKLEQFHEMFKQMFPSARMNSSIPTNVVVFKNKNSYKPFLPRRNDGKADTGIAGYFQPGSDANYITFSTEGEDDEVFGTIFHEYVHYIVNTNFGKSTIPPWFNEGLAEYYQTFRIEKDIQIHLGRHQQVHIDLLRSTKMFPLKDLFTVNNYSLHQNANHSRSIFYAQSWALIHYLIREGKAESLDKFLQSTLKDKPQEQAFQESFGMTYEQMEKELRKYVSRGSFEYTVYVLKNKFLLDASIQVSPMSESMANAYLGDLLMHSNRPADAEPYLMHSLQLDPKNSLANTAMGTAKINQRKFEDAKAYLDKAVSADVGNHTAYYQYAYLLSKSSMDEFGYVSTFEKATAEKMRSLLKKAISLKPDFTESYELLAFLSLVNNEEMDESIKLLKTALRYQPGNQSYAMRIAELLSRQLKYDEARTLAQKLEKTTDDPLIKSRATNLLTQIDQHEMVSKMNAANEKKMRDLIGEQNASGNRPILIKRGVSEISPEEQLRIQNNYKNKMLNYNLRKPLENELRIIGVIDAITCDKGKIAYKISTGTETHTLTSENFADLDIRASVVEMGEVLVGCDAVLSKHKTVITYTKEKSGTALTGKLLAIEFVPNDFKLLTESELKAEDDIVVANNAAELEEIISTEKERLQNGPPVSMSKDLEQQRRDFMMNSIRERLTKPTDGQIQKIGKVSGTECSKKGMFLLATVDSQQLKLILDNDQPPTMIGYTPDAAVFRIGCGMPSLDLKFVITYTDQPDKKTKANGRIIALEAVPQSFTMN